MDGSTAPGVEDFIRRWAGRSGAERANYALFLIELCDLLGVARPRPAGSEAALNDYVFERGVRFRHDDGTTSPGRIDLYKKGCFVLEAKQSAKRREGGEAYDLLPLALRGGVGVLERPRAKAKPLSSWDALMRGAKRQAEDYARSLDEWPPFIVVVDVGHVIELYANFRRDGKGYDQFPNRNAFRITMDDLRSEEVRARLKAVWETPFALNPATRAAEVTQEIAALLARMTQSMEARAKLEDSQLRAEHAYKVSKFLMRCIFAMFAEDMGLLPEGGFLRLIALHRGRANRFHLAANDFFAKMDRGGYNAAIQADIRRFNGGLFRETIAVEMTADELTLLEKAARCAWRNVEPAIFGTLLEQALSERERAKLGAHYTPRAYVERLVVPTIIEPLREDWDAAQSGAIGTLLEHGAPAARAAVKTFHDKLCRTVVLDPACGTGNFLYVSLELMKRLEGEVLDFLKELGEPNEPLQTVHPRQFRGIEKNPRAVLVLWIGYIQWWFRTRQSTAFADPVLDEMDEIKEGDAVLAYDREELLKDAYGRPITRQDPRATKLHPITGEPVPDPDAKLGVYCYVNPKPVPWPEADFIVGNPPFIGGKDLRAELGDGYTEALWASRGKRSDSIDFVMYWWDQAATILRANGSRLRRFGFITTNSITQKFSRRVLEKHLKAAKDPLSLAFAVPDHPWVKSARGLGRKAQVRIGMTVAERGTRTGKLAEVVEESSLDTDQPKVILSQQTGRLNADLSIGTDLTTLHELRGAEGVSGRGVQLMGDGFIVTAHQAAALGLGRISGLDRHIRPYLHNRDLKSRPRGVMVIDLFGLTETDVRSRFPQIWQRLHETVKIDRERQSAKSPTKDASEYAKRWWVLGKPREELRTAIAGLTRIIVTGETSRHRFFEFFSTTVLSSHTHTVFSVRKGGWMGVGNDPRYQAECFSTFPFPTATRTQQATIGALAEELDALRKRVIAQHAFLTMTRLYNVREKLKVGAALDESDRAIHDAGCVGVIHELHRKIDAAVAEAYGWPADLSDHEVLSRLVALNQERAAEERDGLVRWLRPDYQIPRFGETRAVRREQQIEAALEGPASEQPSLPKNDAELVAALRRTLRRIGKPTDAREIAALFREGGRSAKRIERGLQLLGAAGVARRAPNAGWFVADRTS